MSEWQPETINLCIETRPDGGLRVWSPFVPGLILSHPDENKVMSNIIPILRELGHLRRSPSANVHGG